MKDREKTEKSLTQKTKGLLFVVSGPSGVGKSTLCKEIVLKVPGLSLSISYTTRKPRPGEQHGREYFFVDESEFHERAHRQEFAEWAAVYGHLYGTHRRQVLQLMEDGQDVVMDIDVQGARQIMRTFDQAVYVFVMPPSFEALKTRLLQRASDSPNEVDCRLRQAQEEMASYRSYGYVIRNNELVRTLKDFEAVILAERLKSERVDMSWLESDRVLKEEALRP